MFAIIKTLKGNLIIYKLVIFKLILKINKINLCTKDKFKFHRDFPV